jgi:hypothetical protein
LDLLFYSICLHVFFCTSTMLLSSWLCSIIWSQVLHYFQHWSGFSLAIWGLCVSIWILGLFFYFCEECHWKFDRIAVNLYITFGSISILTVFIQLIEEHERSFHLLLSSTISFFSALIVFTLRILTALVKLIPRYFLRLLWMD